MSTAKRLTGGLGRLRGRLAGAMAIAAMVAAGSTARAVIITPTFDSSITSSPYAGTIKGDINSALNFYNTNLSNPVHVNIYFQTTTDAAYLGENYSSLYQPSYSTYTQALLANATAHPGNFTAQTAYNNLQYGNDHAGTSPILATSADMRALGFTNDTGYFNAAGNAGSGPGYIYDGIIYLNATDLAGFGGSGTYSAKPTIQHEVDEVLGIGGQGSQLGNTGSTAYGPMDLFRYSAAHTPSYTASATAISYFSIDGGNTNLVLFNQTAGGDYGDWGGTTTYVQQAFSPSGVNPSVSLTSPEGIALQAIGYNAVSAGPTLTWSPSGSASGNDVSGNWDNTTANWTTGTGTVAWTAGDTAAFGAGTATAITVTLQATVSAGGLVFNAGGPTTGNYYTVAAGASGNTLTLTGNSIVVNSNDLISAPVDFQDGLVLTGTGILTLSGVDTNNFGTVLSSGTLALSGSGSLGSSGIDLSSGAVFDVSQSTPAGGPVIGGLTGLGGTVALGSQSLTVNVPSSGAAVFYGSIVDGGIGGGIGGSLVKIGAGILGLGGTNTYTGQTTINAGTLAIGGTGSIADSSGVALATGATFDISESTATGGVFINGLTGTGGTVALGSQILAVSVASGTNTFGGALADGGYGGGVGGQLIKAGAGTLSLTGPSTYTGETTIAAGTLALVGGGGIAGSSGVDLASGTTLDISGSTVGGGPVINGITGTGAVTLGNNTLTVAPNIADIFPGSISGTGNLTVGGTGSLTLAGTNTYSGITTIQTGAALMANGLSSLGGSSLVNNGLFGNVSPQYAVNIRGGFTQTATGVLVARVGGQQAGQFDQYTVGGTGSIAGNLSVVFQNNYAPVASPVSLTIIKSTTAGNLAGNFSSVSMNAHPINVFAGTVDTGTDLNLIFTLVQPSLIPYAQTPNQLAVAEYLDTTDGYNGASTPSPAYQSLINGIDTNPNQIPGILDQLSPIDLQAFPQVAIQNGINLDETFSQYAQTIDDGARGLNTAGLTLLQPGEYNPNQAALGQMLQSSRRAGIVSLDNNIPSNLPGYLSYLQSQARGASHPAPSTNWGAFLTGSAQFDNFSNADSISSPNITTADVTAGVDYHITQPLAVGVLFNYAHSFITLDSLGSKGSVDSYSPGVYANFCENGWFIDGVAAYTYSSNAETRNITAGTFSSAANGNFSANEINGSIDLGKQIYSTGTNFAGVGGWTLVPMVSLGYTHADFSSFSETGAGPANLNVSSFSTDSFRTVLSTALLYRIVVSPNMAWTPGITLGWRHEYLNDSQGITAQLQGAGTGGFTVNTASPSRDVAIIAPSLSVAIHQNISAFVDYELDLGSNSYHAQQVFAGVTVSF